ncbi:Uncharacterized protein ALO93_05471 [Pseudomonas amygdali pv. sesami]|nr:Uncharacterized protein ALO93_05471 [Pseudomonas amygdali pv. sesami]RMV88102.1 hypothetical protein ALP04_04558 [Pseudomonas amygdali pv. sesami]
MNINGVSNPANIPQQMGLVTGAKHVDPTEDVSLQEAIASEVKTTEKNVFYEYQKEPWLLESINEHITNRLDYVAHKRDSTCWSLRW